LVNDDIASMSKYAATDFESAAHNAASLARKKTMLVTLSIVFCMIGHPHAQQFCQTVQPTDEDSYQAGLSACAMRLQQPAVAWIEEHPKWELDRVRCTPGKTPRSDEA